jgi:hypothetical protein
MFLRAQINHQGLSKIVMVAKGLSNIIYNREPLEIAFVS